MDASQEVHSFLRDNASGATPLHAVTKVIAFVCVALASGCLWHGKLDFGPARQGRDTELALQAPPARSMLTLPAGARLSYPRGWVAVEDHDFVMKLIPATSRRSGTHPTSLRWGEHFISMDIPKLPALRIPGYLPMGRIRAGYVGHLKEQAPDAKVEDLKSPSISDAATALVRTTWPENRPTHVETALLLTHADRVYILRGRSPVEEEPATRTAFDEVVSSLRWNDE